MQGIATRMRLEDGRAPCHILLRDVTLGESDTVAHEDDRIGLPRVP
jgi:hypothetical protein